MEGKILCLKRRVKLSVLLALLSKLYKRGEKEKDCTDFEEYVQSESTGKEITMQSVLFQYEQKGSVCATVCVCATCLVQSP